MKKIGKKPTDDQLLEGGGSGSGSFAKKAGKAAEIAGITAIGGYSVGLPLTLAYKADKLNKEREEAAKTKREAESKEGSMTAGQKQSMQEAKDEEDYQKRKTAPTTKTEMGKGFAKGGSASSRADGCAQRGKTRGTLIT